MTFAQDPLLEFQNEEGQTIEPWVSQVPNWKTEAVKDDLRMYTGIPWKYIENIQIDATSSGKLSIADIR